MLTNFERKINEGQTGLKKTARKRPEREREKYGGCSRKVMPTHLLLLTSEEMDAWWMRGCWPKDKNHRSSKLETGRNVGNAPIKTVFPTWTQYTRARLPLENPKPTSTILYHSQQTYRVRTATASPCAELVSVVYKLCKYSLRL